MDSPSSLSLIALISASIIGCDGTSDAFDAATGDGGVDASRGRTDSHVERDAGPECRQLASEIETWVSANRSCTTRQDCERISAPDLPENGLTFCAAMVARGADREELAPLVMAFLDAGCVDPTITCSAPPGDPACEDNVCVLRDNFDECLACFDEEEQPHCTEDNRTAVNACAASVCLLSESATAGYCPDSAECSDAGGTCHYSQQYATDCPDGQRYDVLEARNNCPEGQYASTCCVPWDQDCTFLGGTTMRLSHDPVTCEENVTCLSGVQGDSCDYAADLSRGSDSPATATITTGEDRAVVVEGEHVALERTFRCEGVAAGEFTDEGEEWTCRSCRGDACFTCTVTHLGLCFAGEG